MKKEDIQAEKLKEQVVIVLDVLLATSTIAALLEHGVKEIIPVEGEREAIQASMSFAPGEYVLIGEKEGRVLDGFLAPNPALLSDVVAGKVVILATTNGTVALRRSAGAGRLYAATLRNGNAVAASAVRSLEPGQRIIVVCSGSSGQFCLEDFYGAGYLVCCLTKLLEAAQLTDGAKAALLFYQHGQEEGYTMLAQSAVGIFLLEHRCEDDLRYVAQKGISQRVPIYDRGRIIWREEEKDGTNKAGDEGWTLSH